MVPMMHANSQMKSYEAAVAEEAETALPGDWKPYDGPILLEFFFWRRLAKYLTGTGRTATKNQVDVTNLQKSTEDGLQGVLFTNDRNVVGVHSYAMEQSPTARAGLVVRMHTDFKLPEVTIDWEAIDFENERRPNVMIQDFNPEDVF